MLTLSSRARYATRIMIYIAARDSVRPASKRDIADNENISPDYVEQILLKLKAAGLIKSCRGVKGGFMLPNPAATISMSDIINAAEGAPELAPCVTEPCTRNSFCAAGLLWNKINRAITGTLASTSLADMVDISKELARNKTFHYEI